MQRACVRGSRREMKTVKSKTVKASERQTDTEREKSGRVNQHEDFTVPVQRTLYFSVSLSPPSDHDRGSSSEGESVTVVPLRAHPQPASS